MILPDRVLGRPGVNWMRSGRAMLPISVLTCTPISLRKAAMPSAVPGCTDETALNFDASAEVDDGSCYYEDDILGCTDEDALNHNPDATYDDGSCVFPELELDDMPVELCLGDSVWISWSGGPAEGMVNLSLINVTGNYVESTLGLVANSGLHPWIVAVANPGDAYRLYIEEHPYPPNTYDCGNAFGVIEDCAPSCPMDLDGDGIVAVTDVLLLLGEFGCASDCPSDINGDDAVTVEDFLLLLGQFGSTCD